MMCIACRAPMYVDSQSAVDAFFKSAQRLRYHCLLCGRDQWTGGQEPALLPLSVDTYDPGVEASSTLNKRKRVAEGKCRQCSAPVEPGLTVCRYHQQYNKAYLAKQRAHVKKLGPKVPTLEIV